MLKVINEDVGSNPTCRTMPIEPSALIGAGLGLLVTSPLWIPALLNDISSNATKHYTAETPEKDPRTLEGKTQDENR